MRESALVSTQGTPPNASILETLRDYSGFIIAFCTGAIGAYLSLFKFKTMAETRLDRIEKDVAEIRFIMQSNVTPAQHEELWRAIHELSSRISR